LDSATDSGDDARDREDSSLVRVDEFRDRLVDVVENLDGRRSALLFTGTRGSGVLLGSPVTCEYSDPSDSLLDPSLCTASESRLDSYTDGTGGGGFLFPRECDTPINFSISV
jgi:hypothetical protein